ncbi:MAG: mandelate racemase/muconate lactonizing enzyme family protein [Desulfobacterales bacterium]|nr:mandelate racemase/muconate lactonizing enzyme family protein [Desulfobacterales bacterium]
MKVTDIKTFFVDSGVTVDLGDTKNWLLIKVETDEGIHGWGECHTLLDRERSIAAYVDHIGKYFVGRNPLNIKHFTTVMYEDYADRQRSMDYFSAISGIELALWDITGKWLNTPVYNLLGGSCRDKIKVYANGWWEDSDTPEAFADKAAKVIESGFKGLKFYPFDGLGLKETYTSKQQVQLAIERVRAVREAIGSDIDLMIDVYRILSPSNAIRAAQMLEKFNPFWYEEPVAPDNLDDLAEVKKNINIPIVTGEALYTKSDFRQVFEKRAADIINPDVCCSGILELKEIAAMAEPYQVAVSPHNYNSNTIGLAASLHVSACIPNFLVLEYFCNFKDRSDEISVNPFNVEGGYLSLPEGPGLGVEINEEALSRYPYQVFVNPNVR